MIKNNKGITLIEMLIAIIGILAAIVLPAYIGQQKRAARAEAFTNKSTYNICLIRHFFKIFLLLHKKLI